MIVPPELGRCDLEREIAEPVLALAVVTDNASIRRLTKARTLTDRARVMGQTYMAALQDILELGYMFDVRC